jgi:septal ring factor EnvC (AmiA/AmiB activator)
MNAKRQLILDNKNKIALRKHISNIMTSLKSEKRYLLPSLYGRGWGVGIFLFLSLLLFTPSTFSQSKQKKTTQKTTATTTKKSSGKATSGKNSGKANTSKTANGKKTSTKKNNAEGNSINSLKKQRDEIKKNIAKQEKALRANKAQVEKKLKDLMVINGEMDRRRQSIDSINHDIHLLDGDIGILNSQLNTLNAQLDARKAQYIKSMRYMAKRRGIQSQMMFVFSGNDFRQIYRRMRFMREYAAYQRTQGKAVQEQQQRVNEKNEQLKAARGVKSNLLWKGKKEHAALEGQKQEQQKVVTSLQKQQKTIENIIDEQKKKDAALNAKIDQLVAEEVERARQRAIAEAKKKAEEEAAAKRKAEELARKKAAAEAAERENQRRIEEAKAAEQKAKADAIAARNARAREVAEQRAREAEAARIAAERKAVADKERANMEVAKAKKESEEAVRLSSADRLVSGGFEANKGRLPSPVAGGRIVSHFGQHGVEGLPGVVLDNKGINILGSPGCAARSIYDGEVTAVFDAGGTMGVLVRHGAYISVYCNLKSVSVAKGQKVSPRQTLGVVGRDNILQFQLRRERDKLNPELWLAR